jgi:pSer/pThr/pTyr-binding forkhead associated (FHA) protein
MAFVQVFFNGALIGERELSPGVTTIGRAADNVIEIDNAGVSAHHARIVTEGERFAVEDLGSTNGVFVNGERVERRELSYGDEIEILKHTLKLVAVSLHGAEQPAGVGSEQPTLDQGATVEVDVSNLGELLKQRQSRKEAYLLIAGGDTEHSRIPLTKVHLRVGRSKDCDIRTPGWFSPRLAARIVRSGNAFVIRAEPRGKVRVNGAPVAVETTLEDGDSLIVRGLSLRFYHRAPQP